MEAMILAAGLGTRLAPLTETMPKALVPVGGVPMLERVARRMVAAGADRLIINTHAFRDAITEFVADRGDFGVEVAFSHEPGGPLETGGGLRHAATLFQRDAPFFLHNVDVLTDLPIEGLYECHLERRPLATLAVMQRQTTRYLLFDDEGLLGRVDEGRDLRIEVRPSRGEIVPLAFAGIHVLSPEIFQEMTEEGAFSILDPYLRLAAAGSRIEPYRIDDSLWIDVGKPDDLARATQLFDLPTRDADRPATS